MGLLSIAERAPPNRTGHNVSERERVIKGDGSLNLPYEQVPGDPVPYSMGGQEIATAVVMLAGVMEIDGRAHPIVIFRFSRGDGTFYPDRVLVVEKNELADLKTLTADAVNGAIKGAERA